MPISRRHFLTGSLAAFAVVAGASIYKWPTQGPVAVAQRPGNEVFRYRGRQVEIEETNQKVSVMVNGVHQHHIAKKMPGRGRPFFASHLLPFENFNSAAVLAKKLIDLEMDLELFALT